jgi:hypothetical protein
MVVLLVLDRLGEIVEHNKNLNFELGDELSLLKLKGVVNNKGKGKLTRQVIWNYNNIDIHCYGYTEGSAINEHKLPKPLDKSKLYGDLVLIGSSNSNFVDLTESHYYEFFSNKDYEDIEDGEYVYEISVKDEEEEEEEIIIEEEEEEEEDTIEVNIIIANELQPEDEYVI